MKIFSKIILMGCLASQLHAQTWNPSPGQIRGTTSNYNTPFCAATPSPNNFIATFTDPSDIPSYSLYNSSTGMWSATPQAITGAGTSPLTLAYPCYGANSTQNINLVVWVANDNTPYYSVFDGSSWNVYPHLPKQIPGSRAVYSVVSSSFNPLNKNFLVTWVDEPPPSGTGQPFIAVLDQNGNWVFGPSAIPDSGIGTFETFIYSSCDSSTGKYLITYCIFEPDPTPYYAIFDGNTLTWDTNAALIPVPSITPGVAVTSAFDPNLGQFLVTWIDFGHTSHYPYYSIFTPSLPQWSNQSMVNPSNPVAGNDDFSAIVPSIDPILGTFLCVWPNATGVPTYATYNAGTWSPATPPNYTIPNAPTAENLVSPAFDSGTNQFMATWRDTVDTISLYDIFTVPGGNNFTSTVVTVTPNPSNAKSLIDIRATVTAKKIIPSGLVIFFINGVPVGQAYLNNLGVANLFTNNLCSGTYRITANYQGNELFLSSSGSTVQIVN